VLATATELVRSDNKALEDDAVQVAAVVRPDGRHVRITVCIDPKAGQNKADAGKYTGTVSFEDPRVTGGSVPVTATLRFDRSNIVLLACLFAALGGLLWAFVITIRGFNAGGGWQRVTVAALASLFFAVPIYVNRYASDPAWSGSSGDFLALMIAVGGAVIAAFPTLNGIVNKVSGKSIAGN
jgi:hypothetical protein